jgi:SAM-dependent methyltransferase
MVACAKITCMWGRDIFKAVIPPGVRQLMRQALAPDSRVVANPYLAATLVPFGDRDGYVIPRVSQRNPLPPRDLWLGYANTADDYLASGRRDMATLLRILQNDGAVQDSFGCVLDLGCASARCLRFFPTGPQSELWGLDIDARHIVWCQQNLAPPMRFATITTAPHLPFADASFDLVYCLSVFTHISQLADAWFLEVRRVLRSGGYAYITIHDAHTLDLLDGKYRDDPLFTDFLQQIDAFRQRCPIEPGRYAWFSVGNGPGSQVFYNVDDLAARWSYLAHLVSVTPEAHDHQTALLFQKR